MVGPLEAQVTRAAVVVTAGLMLLSGIFGFTIGEVGASTPKPTWNYQVEDDAPACWLNVPHITCGPASWAPARAVAVTPPFTPCEEDQPCWDCRTMGNRICGPRP